MLSRNEGLTLLKKYLRNENLRKHSFAVEAILREIACRLQKDEELWALTGLLHDKRKSRKTCNNDRRNFK
jgi:predicted hydrolase (HD superfamily)